MISPCSHSTERPSLGTRGLALAYGFACHVSFVISIAIMICVMGSGMSLSLGRVPWPWCWIANFALLAQFPLGHSLLLSSRHRHWLRAFAPLRVVGDLVPTVYVAVASLQVALLFTAWTPTGIIWWQAAGGLLPIWVSAYASAWLLLAVSMGYAGLSLQTGFNGWWAVYRGCQLRYPDMPIYGPFRIVRQPIYLSFALTTWTVPVWTPDQLVVATVLTGYCILGPRLKEARFRRIYGQRFEEYASRVPYMAPVPPAIRKLMR